METDNRRKTKRVYSYKTILRATKLITIYVRGSHATYEIIDNEKYIRWAKKKLRWEREYISEHGEIREYPKECPEYKHYVFWNRKITDWTCDCHHYANRTAPNKNSWGYCAHILAVLYRKATSTFEKEIMREREIK